MDAYSTLPLASSPTPQHDVTTETIENARQQFSSLLGADNVVSDPEECHKRSSSPWSPAPATHAPQLIVFPDSTADVSNVIKLCHAHIIPVFAYSSGTGLGGVLVATNRGVCIDFKRMDRMLALNVEDMDVTVQPGVGWQRLNEDLLQQGLFFPPDPAPGAKIGGMVAMGCSGTNTYRYGTMRDWVISLTVVLADGSVVKTRRRPRKSSAGYDLTHLIVGSEGTLGIVTEAVLKLTVAPQNLHVSVAQFPSTNLAVKAAVSIVNAGLLVDALELMDKQSMHALISASLSPEQWAEKSTLFIKYSGAEHSVREQVALVERLSAENECTHFQCSSDERITKSWWEARKAILPGLVGMKKHPTDVFLSADAAVPISRVADMIDQTCKASEKLNIFCSNVGHIGDGNVHTAVVCAESQRAVGEALIAEVQQRALRLEGTITGEHGVGLGLRDLLVDEIGETGVDLTRKIKFALDPKCILNPGKVVRVSP